MVHASLNFVLYLTLGKNLAFIYFVFKFLRYILGFSVFFLSCKFINMDNFFGEDCHQDLCKGEFHQCDVIENEEQMEYVIG